MIKTKHCSGMSRSRPVLSVTVLDAWSFFGYVYFFCLFPKSNQKLRKVQRRLINTQSNEQLKPDSATDK